MPKVLNKRAGNIPIGAVLVDRTTKWGNPWRIGEEHPEDGHRLTREEVIEMYRNAISRMLEAKRNDGTTILDLEELRGKDLVCWCAPLPCHADILLRLANDG